MFYLVLIFTLVIAGLIALVIFQWRKIKQLPNERAGIFKEKQDIENSSKGLKAYNQKIQQQKQEQQAQILNLLDKQEKITNNDVEKLLGVSDATATRYLDALEKQGKIEAFGKSAKTAFYRLKQ